MVYSKDRYTKRKERFEQLVRKQTKAINIISNLRLAVFLLGAAAAIYSYWMDYYYLLAGILGAFAFSFVYLIIQHDRLFNKRKIVSAVCKINEISLKRINSQWVDFPDTGEEFRDEGHPYTLDLDIFGRGSLFQWVNSTNTFLGRHILKALLASPEQRPENIAKRQEAVAELAKKLPWRQRFWAEGHGKNGWMEDPEPLIRWAGEQNPFYRRFQVVAFFRCLPPLTVATVLLCYPFGIIPVYYPLFTVLTQLVLLKLNLKARGEIFGIARKYHQDIKAYYQLLRLFENKKFSPGLMTELGKKLRNKKGKSASRQVDQLSKIMDAVSNRENGFFFFINLLTLWDYQCLIALERWKAETGENLHAWFQIIGEVEAISSLAVIAHDHPEWCKPEIHWDGIAFEARDLGHPLLPKGRVTNHLSVADPVRVLLITGSNMSGKSTLLRTAGINLVLAYAGAPVCASAFRASMMEIHSCMRVSDNLERSISSFYAELLRIKTIVEAAKEGKKLFFLLDEIFKGTNSMDRHTGAKILIEYLCKTNAVGLVSTHDLELCSLEKEQEKIRNYHFTEYYKDNRIYFDYKLKPGASTTRNAVYLMRMAGIEIPQEG